MFLSLHRIALIPTSECDVKTLQYHANALVVCLVQVALPDTEAVWDKGRGFGTQLTSFNISSCGLQHQKIFTVKFISKDLANIPLIT